MRSVWHEALTRRYGHSRALHPACENHDLLEAHQALRVLRKASKQTMQVTEGRALPKGQRCSRYLRFAGQKRASVKPSYGTQIRKWQKTSCDGCARLCVAREPGRRFQFCVGTSKRCEGLLGHSGSNFWYPLVPLRSGVEETCGTSWKESPKFNLGLKF